MDPFAGPPHSFPRTQGGTGGALQNRNNGFRTRRGHKKRLLRSPAWVRVPLTTTTTTTAFSHRHHHDPAILQPIMRFCRRQDLRSPVEPPVLALMDNWSSRDIVLSLQAASRRVKEEVFWGICLQVYELLMQHPNPLQLRICLPRVQNPLLEDTPASRYWKDFAEMEELGRGGFGRVVKAKNKVDGLYYAIKMILIKGMGESSLEACLSEGRTLAKLNHPRVVRYFSTWVEDASTLDSLWPSATVRELGSETSDETSTDSSRGNGVSVSLPSDYGVVFQDGGAGEAGGQAPSPSPHSILQHPRHSQGITHPQGSAMASSSLLPYRPQLLAPYKVLCIQMGLYGKSLRKWMDERNNSEFMQVLEWECLRIFHQVVEAVCYIHLKGYMHRDIKPANILFSLEGDDVQVGDFGLARLIAHPSTASPDASLTLQTYYSRNVGTPFYTAPEVKEGNYGEKSDMYSLGIILLELFMPFKTAFERSVVIGKLKASGDLDPDLIHRWPSIADWIKKLADNDPANRPSARELFESPLFPPPIPPPTAVELTRSQFTSINTIEVKEIKAETSVNTCTVRIEEFPSKDDQITELKEENDRLKRQVEGLQRKLKLCNIDITPAAEY